MNKKTFFIFVLVFVLFSVTFPPIQNVKAQSTIYIREDGTVEGTNKIQKDEDLNRFVMLDNIVGHSIVIERRMGSFDGNGFSIQGYGNGTGIFLSGRGTIKNLTVTGFETGILVVGDNLEVSNCNLTKNNIGLYFKQDTYRIKDGLITGNYIAQNTVGLKIGMGTEGEKTGLLVVGNQIVNNSIGLVFSRNAKTYIDDTFSMNAQLYKNSFINNYQTINHETFFLPYLPVVANGYVNIWDNGSEGNYWSSYNGTDQNNDGIIDEPLKLTGENIDNYPLITPQEIQTIPEFPSLTLTSLLGLTMLIVLIFRKNYIKQQNKIHP